MAKALPPEVADLLMLSIESLLRKAVDEWPAINFHCCRDECTDRFRSRAEPQYQERR